MATRETIIKVQLENQDAVRQLGKWEAELIGVRKETTALTAEIRKNNGATPEQTRRLGELRSTAKNLSGNIRELSNETSGLTAAGMRFRDKMAGASLDALKQFGGGILTVSGGIALLGKVLGNASDIIAEFDKAQSNLAAILNTNKAGITELTEEAKRYGATTAFTASQVSELQTELAKLGFTQDQIKAATPAVLDLAAATGTDLANAATIAAQTLNAFQLSASETGRIVDVIAQSANLSAFDIDTFSAAMSNAAPAAKSVGVEIEQAAAMLSALVDAGIPAEKAGTDLRNIFIKLAEEGMTMDEAFAAIRGSTNQLADAVKLFDQRAAGSAIILAENTDKLGKLEEAYMNASGAAAEMAKTQLDNLRGDQLLLQSAWEGFILSVEDGSGVISSVMRGLTQSVTDLLESLNGANEETSSFTSRVLGLLTGSSIIQGYEDTAKWWNKLFGSDTQEEISATAQAVQGVATATNNLPEFEVIGERATVGKELDKLKTKREELKEARNELTLSDVAGRKEIDADIKSTEASIAALEGRTTATKAQAAAIRVLTDELRAFQKAQQDINAGVGIGQMDLRGTEPAAISDPASRLLPGTGALIDNEETKKKIRNEYALQELQDAANLSNALQAIMNAGFQRRIQDQVNNTMALEEKLRQASTAAERAELESQIQQSKKQEAILLEQRKKMKAFAIAGALINTYMAANQVLADATNFTPIGKFLAMASVIATGLANVAKIQGFEEGGYTSKAASNKKAVGVVHANEWVAPAWMVKSKEFAPTLQQLEDVRKRRANRMTGMSRLTSGGVPGFAAGGSTTEYRFRKGNGMTTGPRPSPAELNATRNAMTAMQTPIYVAVDEINRVQGRVARIQERATL